MITRRSPNEVLSQELNLLLDLCEAINRRYLNALISTYNLVLFLELTARVVISMVC